MTELKMNEKNYKILHFACKESNNELVNLILKKQKPDEEQLLEVFELVDPKSDVSKILLREYHDIFVAKLIKKHCPHDQNKVNMEWMKKELSTYMNRFNKQIDTCRSYLETVLGDERLTKIGKYGKIAEAMDNEGHVLYKLYNDHSGSILGLLILLDSEKKLSSYYDKETNPPDWSYELYDGLRHDLAEYLYIRTKYAGLMDGYIYSEANSSSSICSGTISHGGFESAMVGVKMIKKM